MHNSGFQQLSEVDGNGGNPNELYVELPSSREKGQKSNWKSAQSKKLEHNPRLIPDRVKDEFYVELPSLDPQGHPEPDGRDDPFGQSEHQSPQIPNRRPTEYSSNSHTGHTRTCTAVVRHVSPPTAVILANFFLGDRPGYAAESGRTRPTRPSPEEGPYISTFEHYRTTSGTITEDAEGPTEPCTRLRPLEPAVSSQSPLRISDERYDRVKEFVVALGDPSKSNQYVFRLYRHLPSPGMPLIRKQLRQKLLSRFSKPMNKRRVDARRYIALVDDMIKADLPMSRAHWTSAIHLASRGGSRQDLVRAIGVWHQMEHQGGVESDGVVFTILFESAVKAGQFTVADRILNEMANRGISTTRGGYVTRMFYYGKMGDVDGIRQTYSDLVRAGHLVDTVILNCLIASFARANDNKTVTGLYDSMLEAHWALRKRRPCDNAQAARFLPPLSSEMSLYRRRNRELGRQLEAMISLKKDMPERHHAIQQSLPMSPDTRTFYILLNHHARRTGSLKQFMSTVRDMESVYTVPPRGMIYLLLFEGFASHGGRRSHWTAEKLRYAWHTYLRALNESMKRYNERFHCQTQRLVWENPLNKSARTVKKIQMSKRPIELYIPLPGSNPNAGRPLGEGQGDNEPVEKEDDSEEREEPDDSYDLDPVDVDELFNNPVQTREAWDEMAELDRQIENGVFLGRQMIVLILRAFGACCDPDELVEVWLTIDRLWYPGKRKASDVQIVKEELDTQMRKAERRSKGERG